VRLSGVWHLLGTIELGARDAFITAATSIGRLTDTLTKCLTQGRGLLHCTAHRR